MSERRHFRLALLSLLLLGALLVFDRLGNGMLEVYDEGLYGMYGRTALHYDTWLHVVNAQGKFPVGAVKFSKPPLSVWLVAASFRLLGPSLFALRLPFALATLLTALLALAFGRLLEPGRRGTWLGFAWGAAWLISHGAYHFGRTATIEAPLVCLVLAALYAHARARRSAGAGRLGWAFATGLAIAAAFMLKQLVCALAVVPIVLIELSELRRERLGVLMARTLPALGLPFVVAVTWLIALYRKVGPALQDVLWQHAIVSRVTGFNGIHHQNYLNRIEDQLDLDAVPMCWQISVLGLLLLLWTPPREAAADRAPARLIALWLGCAWLAFGVGSRAILPWYALSFVPPLALGQAFLAACCFEAAISGPPPERTRQLAAAAGAAGLVYSLAVATHELLPGLALAVLLSAAIAWGARELPMPRGPLLGVGAALGALLLSGTLARPAYRASESDPLSVLGLALQRLGAHHVAVDARMDMHSYARNTFFGPGSRETTPPWQSPHAAGGPFDAWVSEGVLPRELGPRHGIRVVRAGGAYAFFGHLAEAPFASGALASVLARGPLTFEAEQMASDRDFTLAADARASGHALRRVEPRLWEKAESFSLAHALTPELPAGAYRVSFWVRYRCHGLPGEEPGKVAVRAGGQPSRSARLRCGKSALPFATALAPLAVDFTLRQPAPLALEVRYEQDELAVDRVSVQARAPTRAARPRR